MNYTPYGRSTSRSNLEYRHSFLRNRISDAQRRDSAVRTMGGCATAGYEPRLPRAPSGKQLQLSTLPTTRRRRADEAPSLPLANTQPIRSQSTVGSSGRLCCDKCDGGHHTDRCPVFPKPRENHPDALRRKPPEMGRPCGNKVVTSARVVRQPGDGNCLFHSLAYGLGCCSAASLRRELADWVQSHPDDEIAETPIRSWLWWDQRQSPTAYASRMRVSGVTWGGGIELAACSRARHVNVHVWERNRLGPGYRRISCFDCPSGSGRTLNVIYQGGVHYDALCL
eukprot:TRINITY_DN6929_c0_g1_i1.p1 TRINITY_DN6929_c0_g1~~TRINITY_DN6929_c0_g1_i1.p1  ORF type:complete len:282 (+),score=58.83 TRINITY_DN6929_c0_g1_i1:64-909(+)